MLKELEQARHQLSQLEATQDSWSQISVSDRVQHLHQIADRVVQKKEAWARLASQEMGKPITQARLEIEKSIKALIEIPKLAPQVLAKQTLDDSEVWADNYRVVLSIQPWNFPFWQVLRMAACAWVTGHTVMLKHSELVPGCAQAIEEVCDWENQKLLRSVILGPEDLHTLIQQSHAVGLVTFTGSTQVGRKIAETCGRSLKKTILELGGNDAYFVMPDCDLPKAAWTCAKSRLINSGQSCVAAKRFFIHKKIKQEFIHIFHQVLAKSQRGDPLKFDTEVGPAAHSRFLSATAKQIEKAQQLGAIYTQVFPFQDAFSAVGSLDFQNQLTAFEDEEIFAPIALFYEFEHVEDCVKAVNAGPYGLAGGIFTADLSLAQKMAKLSQVGTFTINGFSQSDPLLPFGGTKSSGFGREMGSQGLLEFVNWKVVRHGS